MGEIIDTRPIESVQAALSLFGDPRRYSPNNKKSEVDKEKDFETILKDLARLKLQLEAKDSAHKQALFLLSQNENALDDLLAQLMTSGLEKDIYINECISYKGRMEEFMLQSLEFAKIREQLSCALPELRATQGEILSLEAELVATRDAKVNALRRAEIAETALCAERIKCEELNDTIFHLKTRFHALSEREEEMGLITANVKHEAELLKTKSKSVIAGLEKDLSKKNEVIATLEKEIVDSATKLNKLESDLELQERKNWDQSGYNSLLETEIKQLKQQLSNANERIVSLEADAKEKVSKADEEIALLKLNIAEAQSSSEKIRVESEQAKRDAYKQLQDSRKELELRKRELERNKEKVGELRMRNEQAISRAEAAEKAQATLENRIMRWKELKEKRKQAMAALRQDSISRETKNNNSPINSPKPARPLGKVLKIEY